MKNFDKDLALPMFKEMIENSWTYERLTNDEKQRLSELFMNIRVFDALKGSYNQRWEILEAIYTAFLKGVGYTNFNWRENKEVARF